MHQIPESPLPVPTSKLSEIKTFFSNVPPLSSQEESLQKRKAEVAASEQKRREIQRRLVPVTSKDFEVLYSELDVWVERETDRIGQEGGEIPEERRRLRREVLTKETILLRKIDSLKARTVDSGKPARIHQGLQEMAEPGRWKLSSGEEVQVITPYTICAKGLKYLYENLIGEQQKGQ